MTATGLLALVLRCGGGVMALAFVAVLLPTDWMAWVHERVGLGTFPRAPIVDSLTAPSRGHSMGS